MLRDTDEFAQPDNHDLISYILQYANEIIVQIIHQSELWRLKRAKSMESNDSRLYLHYSATVNRLLGLKEAERGFIATDIIGWSWQRIADDRYDPTSKTDTVNQMVSGFSQF